MQLTQAEIIQIMRRRKGLNQAELGVNAFDLRPDSGRTKIKNIELGLQLPTTKDVQKIAQALEVELNDMSPVAFAMGNHDPSDQEKCFMSEDVVKLFPGLKEYVEMLNNAVQIGDNDLIYYISAKLSSIFEINSKRKLAANN